MIDHKKLSLENFVNWLITAAADDKFIYRHKICETVHIFGKDKVLDELGRQAQSFKDIGSAIQTTHLIKDIN